MGTDHQRNTRRWRVLGSQPPQCQSVPMNNQEHDEGPSSLSRGLVTIRSPEKLNRIAVHTVALNTR